MRLRLIAPLVALGACAQTAAELSWSVCAVSRGPQGGDIDDGGVDVFANVGRGTGRTPRRLEAGHYPGTCWREGPPEPLPALTCGDPFVDVRYVLSWTRPAPTSLVLERLEYPIADQDDVPTSSAPIARRSIATVRVTPDARITVSPRLDCPGRR